MSATSHPAMRPLFDMEGDARSTPELLCAAIVMAEHGMEHNGLSAQECEGLFHVVTEARQRARGACEGWERVFKLVREPNGPPAA